MSEARMTQRDTWFGPTSLLAAGLFCLVLGVFLGGKLVAAGHALLVLGFLAVWVKRDEHRIEWRTIPKSGWWLAGFMIAAALSI
ncbi:MAG: hypothetical protein GXX91_12765, partial [Verrucomicrobiaceae bacterium]|nr:hypothetical protein [Verrucomicrobiaceae bacterium]